MFLEQRNTDKKINDNPKDEEFKGDKRVFVEGQHTFFPDFAESVERELNSLFKIRTRIIVTPRTNSNHSISPLLENRKKKNSSFVNSPSIKRQIERTDETTHAGAYISNKEIIFVNPEFSSSLLMFINDLSVGKANKEKLLHDLRNKLEKFRSDHSQTLSIADELPIKEVEKAIENFLDGGTLGDLYDAIENLAQRHPKDSVIYVLFTKVFFPLISENIELRKKTFEIIRIVSFHEAIHQWLESQIVDILPSDFLERLKSFFEEKDKKSSMMKGSIQDLPGEEDSENELIAALRRQKEKEYKVLFKDMTPEQAHVMIFYLMWQGFEEDMARAISMRRFRGLNQKYSRNALLLYYREQPYYPYGGNLTIDSMMNNLDGRKRKRFSDFIDDQAKFLGEVKTKIWAESGKIVEEIFPTS